MPKQVSGTNTTITGLTPNTDYTFSVSAVDTSDNESARSQNITATTQSDSPAVATHYYPMDEGSGTVIADTVGTMNFTLSSSSWVQGSNYEGGVAPSFDGSGIYAEASYVGSVPFTYVIRAVMNNPGSYPNVFAFNHDPQVYADGGAWNTDYLSVSDPGFSAGDERIFAFQRKSGTTRMIVYDEAGNTVGSNTSSSFQNFSSNTMYLGQAGDNRYFINGVLDQLMIAESYLSLASINSLITNYYL